MKTLNLYSWNVNGVRAVERKGAFQWFFDERPDILCLQEIKATAGQVPWSLRGLEGYYKYYFSAERKGYSGVAVFTKRKPLSMQKGMGDKRFDSEGRTLVLDYPEFTLLNVYFPNGKASKARLEYKMKFYAAFLRYINKLRRQGKNIIFCGDVNTAHKEIDLARPKQNQKTSGFLPEERAWIDRVVGHGYVDTLRMFTDEPGLYSWWDMKTRARERNVGWRIDYFFASESLRENVRSAAICPTIDGSDHCPVHLALRF